MAGAVFKGIQPVSYTHLDVYKRQVEESENQVTVTYRYGVLVHPETETRVTYTVGAVSYTHLENKQQHEP